MYHHGCKDSDVALPSSLITMSSPQAREGLSLGQSLKRLSSTFSSKNPSSSSSRKPRPRDSQPETTAAASASATAPSAESISPANVSGADLASGLNEAMSSPSAALGYTGPSKHCVHGSRVKQDLNPVHTGSSTPMDTATARSTADGGGSFQNFPSSRT